ncbi:MAG: hypothetical protein A2Z49_10170 [Chloroflexi bacterium RBG_19FT_COMBO_56_12]|nr:MAG: hypothetical protein A2Z49_10170 [Chloroflexi bacterium RBG_19FT_COMBO_56_12]
MRITNEILLKLANDTVARRVQDDHSLLAAYLHGSLLRETPLLGNATDVDLFYIHNDEVSLEREIIRLTDEVHLDIAHHSHKVYRQPRELRQHPWLGPAINSCKILYDPQHFLDFAQASVRGQFNRPDQVVGRVSSLSEHARQIWLDFHLEPREPGPQDILKYMRAIEHAANSIAGISGPPLTERRFLLDLPARVDAVQRHGLYAGVLGLLGAPTVDAETLRSWLPAWQAAFIGLPAAQAPLRLHPHRLPYYQHAIETILGSERYQDALWPFWHTWTVAINALPEDSAHRAGWEEAGRRLGQIGAGFVERIRALDAFLDTVEDALEVWARENGA